MGQLLNQSGVAGRPFDNPSVAPRTTARRYGSRGDAHSNTFAATTGIVGASVVSMGLLFTNQCSMQSTINAYGRRYNRRRHAGHFIPPSIMLVFMGSAANVSVGKLFYGAMTPGVLLGAAYIVYVKVISIVKKDYAPPMPDEVLSRYSKNR